MKMNKIKKIIFNLIKTHKIEIKIYLIKILMINIRLFKTYLNSIKIKKMNKSMKIIK